MAKTQSLKAADRKRTGTGVLRKMRREGYIPSVVYGGGAGNRNVKIVARDFRAMISHSASANILVTLSLEDGGSQLAFVKDLQHDPLTGAILHADFLAVSETSEITAQIPVELHGDAIGVKAGGQLEHLLYTIEIKCLPKDLPETIKADVTNLQIGEMLNIGDIDWPEGVEPTLGAEVVVAMVAKARVATEEEEAEAAEAEAAEAEGAAEGGEDEEKSED